MKTVISALSILLLTAAANGSTLAPGHVLWDLTAEQDTYVVGQQIPSQDSLGDPLDFTVQSDDINPLKATATTVQNWTDPSTGQTMPGKAILVRRDSSHTDTHAGEIILNGGGAGYDKTDPMVTGQIKVSLDVMIDSSSLIPSSPGWKAEGYLNVQSYSTSTSKGMKNSVGFQTGDEEIVEYDPVGLNVEPKTWDNYPVPLDGPFYGYAHHVEMITDYDAQTYQVWVDGNTNGMWDLPESPAGEAWAIPTYYRIMEPSALIEGSAAYGQFVFDNIKVEVVPEPASLVLLGLGFCGLLAVGRKK